MTHGGSGGLVVDAEVRRGSFTLEVSLAAAPGQVLGLLGPNGAGKSTLLSAVAGLTPVSAGRVTLAGSFPGQTETMPIAVYYALEDDPDAAIALSLVLLLVSVVVLVSLRDRWLRGSPL